MSSHAVAASCDSTPDHEVLIVGAGFCGIGTAIELQRAGIDDVVLVEKWPRVGGTWYANSYPGIAVDIPSFVYSFSYAQRSDWSRLFAPGVELQAYAEELVDTYGLRSRLRLGTEVTAMSWEEDRHWWRVSVEPGEEITARYVIGCTGALSSPKLPAIAGIEDYTGTMIHSARWDHSLDLRGRRVGVIGTGASAVQLIPEVAAVAGELTVFQRTPIWVIPKRDPETDGPLSKLLLGQPVFRWPLRALGSTVTHAFFGMLLLPERVAAPLVGALEGQIKAWMATQVDDPVTLEKLTPHYRFGCKRPSISNTYLETFNLPHVTLETDPIARVAGATVHMSTGGARELDLLVCATGFTVQEPDHWIPYPMYGSRGVDLRQFWVEHKCQAYEGITVPGYPNAFILPGPYALPVGSYLWAVELQAVHLRRALLEARRLKATRIEVRQEPHDRYFERCLRRSRRMYLYGEACAGSNSYYINSQGEVALLRPELYPRAWWQAHRYDLDDYRFSAITARSRGPRHEEHVAA